MTTGIAAICREVNDPRAKVSQVRKALGDGTLPELSVDAIKAWLDPVVKHAPAPAAKKTTLKIRS